MAKTITELDIAIGEKIVKARKALRLTRKDLAHKLHITHQQLQKYENGINRITASRLSEISKILKVDINYFYNDLDVKSVLREDGKNYISEDSEEIALLLSNISKNKMDAVKNLLRSIITEEN